MRAPRSIDVRKVPGFLPWGAPAGRFAGTVYRLRVGVCVQLARAIVWLVPDTHPADAAVIQAAGETLTALEFDPMGQVPTGAMR